ncbi:MAG: hypothetical protein R2792_11460 [Saprospiraceae bacterium]
MKNQLLLIAFFLSSNFVLAQGSVDTIPPTIQCKSTLTVTIPNSTCELYLWASDFIDGLSDNITSPDEIQIGIRKPCTGVGFPEEVHVVMYELGVWQLEVWAKDEAGNTSTCTSQIICTQDNAPVATGSGVCCSPMAPLSRALTQLKCMPLVPTAFMTR